MSSTFLARVRRMSCHIDHRLDMHIPETREQKYCIKVGGAALQRPAGGIREASEVSRGAFRSTGRPGTILSGCLR